MRIFVLDFESFFSQTFSLTKLSTEEYVRSPEFKAHMLGLWEPAAMTAPVDVLPAMLETNDDLRKTLSESAIIAHHAHFDGLILEHHYGIRPAFWFDTLSMARLTLPQLRSHSLDSLAAHFGLGAKSVPYNEFRGVRDLAPELYSRLSTGCRRDVTLTWEIFRRLMPLVPPDELKVIDSTVRMFVEPVLRLDRPRMEKFLLAERVRKAKAMLHAGEAIGIPVWLAKEPDELRDVLARIETELQSADKFRLALESLGYPCPMKWSEKATTKCGVCDGTGEIQLVRYSFDGDSDRQIPDGCDIECCEECGGTGKVKGGYIPALAKNDDGMKALLEHPDSRVQALAAARLQVKSTINETRAVSLLGTDTRGAMTVNLKPYAAKTLRFGGADDNYQNLPRGGEIRQSLLAPEGHKLVIADAGQVECRGLNKMAGEQWVIDAFAAGRDIYCENATERCGRVITKADVIERHIDKTLELGCGYGLGWVKYQRQMKQGMLGGPSIVLSDQQAQESVGTYRRKHPRVKEMWSFFGKQILPALCYGSELVYDCLQIKDHRIYLPNGAWLDYTGMRWGYYDDAAPQPNEDPQWWHPSRKGPVKYYGGKLVENVIQALWSGLFIRQAMNAIATRYKIVLQVHDEIVCSVREDEAEDALAWMCEVLETPPSWCPGIPLAAEGIVSRNYSK